MALELGRRTGLLHSMMRPMRPCNIDPDQDVGRTDSIQTSETREEEPEVVGSTIRRELSMRDLRGGSIALPLPTLAPPPNTDLFSGTVLLHSHTGALQEAISN